MKQARSPWFHYFFVKTTLATLLVMLILLSGVLSLQSLRQESYPDLAIPQAIVSVVWPGASSQLVESKITRELEKKLRSIPGLKKLQSASKNSVAIVIVQFRVEVPMDKAMQSLRTKVAEARSAFPTKAEAPYIEQPSTNDVPVGTWMVTSSLPQEVTSQRVEALKKKLEQVPGVRKVEVTGRPKKAIHVKLMPARLQQLSISPLLVFQRIREANRTIPVGEMTSSLQTQRIIFDGQFQHVKKLSQLPILTRSSGHIVRLKDVANVTYELREQKQIVRFRKQGQALRRAIGISVYQRSGQDTVRLVAKLQKTFQGKLSTPAFAALRVTQVQNESAIIKESIRSVLSNGWQSMLVVFLVLLVLLAWREALIAALSIPLTFLTVLVLIWMLGYTLNQMVIIGMVLALGMLVDVFILVMEGMHEALGPKQMTFAEAAADTVKKYALPAFAGQATTVLAMTPLMMVGGVDGKFIRLIPITAILCLLASFVVAFLLSIPLSRFVLRSSQQHQPSWMDRGMSKLVGWWQQWLQHYALASRKQSRRWVVVATLFFVGSLTLSAMLPSTLYPKADGRNLGITVSLEMGTPLQQTEKLARKLEKVLAKQPYLASVTSYVGRKSPLMIAELSDLLTVYEGSHLLGFSGLLVPKSARSKLGYQYIPALEKELQAIVRKVPGAKLVTRIETGGSSNAPPVQIVLSGSTLAQLKAASNDVQRALRKMPGVYAVQDDLGMTQDEIAFLPRRKTMQDYQLTAPVVGHYLSLLTSSTKVRQLQPNNRKEIDIYLSTHWSSESLHKKTPPRWEQLKQMGVIVGAGLHLPLSMVVQRQERTTFPKLLRRDGERSVTVLARLQTGQTLEDVQARLQSWLQKSKPSWSTTTKLRWAGQSEDSQELYGSMFKALLFAMCLIFAVLVLLFGSFRQPWIIFASILLALSGVLMGFFLLGMAFSFPAMIGVVALTGIVVNNSIVMVESMNDHRKSGASVAEAAAQGASDRLRPILSTTLTTIVGLLPLALSDPMWMPLCMAIVLGLSFATVTGQILTPCLYVLAESSSSQPPAPQDSPTSP